MKLFCKISVVLVSAFMIVGLSTFAVAAYPDKPVELVTHSAPGGGSDVFARNVIDMMAKEKLLPVPLVVVNKPGGSGAVATAYVAKKKDDPYTLFATTTSIYTTLVKGEVKVTLDDFTPICGLMQDPNILTVSADAPFKNVKEFIAEAKKKRKGITMGLTSLGSSDQISAHRIEKETGVEFNVVSFKAGSEAFTALLGGHVNFSVGNPGETSGLIDAGRLRVLATLTDKRLPFMPKVPTLKEEGVNVAFYQLRGIWGTKNMPKEVSKYWETVFLKLTGTASWKKYLEKDLALDNYMESTEYKKFLEKELKMYEVELSALGQIKKK